MCIAWYNRGLLLPGIFSSEKVSGTTQRLSLGNTNQWDFVVLSIWLTWRRYLARSNPGHDTVAPAHPDDFGYSICHVRNLPHGKLIKVIHQSLFIDNWIKVEQRMFKKIIIGSVIALVVIIAGNIFFPVPQAAIEVAAEPIGLGPITNALFTSIILSIIIIVTTFFIGRNLKENPGGLQNIVEFLIESLDGLVIRGIAFS